MKPSGMRVARPASHAAEPSGEHSPGPSAAPA
eukprot:CAMPEP_0175301026 /NCGR_PEP_ID=MMETSP0093-20121207/61416_1 /TAXON_ID=311494 /ORGANISM="Alexandrium monilatum, Strain CCMP3105" /LENGTH=31 /DNA_ID= /DNA_START= /DNA_END= /DNA_ORIENTATION=